MQTLTESMGKNHRRYWNGVECFLKWSPKRSVSNNKSWNEMFHFKIRTNATFYKKKKKINKKKIKKKKK